MRPGSCRCTGSSFNNKNTATQIDSDYSITRTEPTGVWFSTTPPVGQGVGLFYAENQKKRRTPTNSSHIFLLEPSKGTKVCVGRSRGFLRFMGRWV